MKKFNSQRLLSSHTTEMKLLYLGQTGCDDFSLSLGKMKWIFIKYMYCCPILLYNIFMLWDGIKCTMTYKNNNKLSRRIESKMRYVCFFWYQDEFFSYLPYIFKWNVLICDQKSQTFQLAMETQWNTEPNFITTYSFFFLLGFYLHRYYWYLV